MQAIKSTNCFGLTEQTTSSLNGISLHVMYGSLVNLFGYVSDILLDERQELAVH